MNLFSRMGRVVKSYTNSLGTPEDNVCFCLLPALNIHAESGLYITLFSLTNTWV